VQRWFAVAVVVAGCYRDVTALARMDASVPPSGCIDTSFLSGSDDPNRALWSFSDDAELSGSGWNAPPGATLAFYAPGLVSSLVSVTLAANTDAVAGVTFSVATAGENASYTVGATTLQAGLYQGGVDGTAYSTLPAVPGPIILALNGSSGSFIISTPNGMNSSILPAGSAQVVITPVIDAGSGGALISDIKLCF
jgi:hypothetical protein